MQTKELLLFSVAAVAVEAATVVGMAAQVSTGMSSTTTTLPGAAGVAVEANGTVRATSPDKRPPPPPSTCQYPQCQ